MDGGGAPLVARAVPLAADERAGRSSRPPSGGVWARTTPEPSPRTATMHGTDADEDVVAVDLEERSWAMTP